MQSSQGPSPQAKVLVLCKEKGHIYCGFYVFLNHIICRKLCYSFCIPHVACHIITELTVPDLNMAETASVHNHHTNLLPSCHLRRYYQHLPLPSEKPRHHSLAPRSAIETVSLYVLIKSQAEY